MTDLKDIALSAAPGINLGNANEVKNSTFEEISRLELKKVSVDELESVLKGMTPIQLQKAFLLSSDMDIYQTAYEFEYFIRLDDNHKTK